MNGKLKFSFTSKIWRYAGYGGWHFVSLPQEMSKTIRKNFKSEEKDWGRLKATAKIGRTHWETAVWFDTKQGAYILPLKADIRKKENLEEGADAKTFIWI